MSDTPVSPEKIKLLEERMKSLGIKNEDLEEKFIHAQGRGGQKVNKTSSCVYLKHTPSGIEVKCQKSRSRAANRFFARRMITDKLEESLLGEKSPSALRIEKIRKQKKKRTKRAREKTAK